MQQRTSIAPSLLVSLLFHGAIIAAVIWLLPKPKFDLGPSSVAVTVVTSGPPASTAPEPVVAPEETAPPVPPEPQPAPPQPAPPAPKAAKVTPSAKPQPAHAPTPDTYDPLKAARAAAAGSRGAPPQHAAKAAGAPAGPQRISLTPQQAGVALRGMVDKVWHLWGLDCDIMETRKTVAPVRFVLGENGRFTSGPTLVDQRGNPVSEGDAPIAARAALTALKKGQPYLPSEVPMQLRNQTITMNFKADEACRNR